MGNSDFVVFAQKVKFSDFGKNGKISLFSNFFFSQEMYCWQQGTLLLRDAKKEQVGYHSWIQEGKSPLMTGRRNCGCRGCGMVLGLIVILLLVSVLEDEWYEEFQGGLVLIWCERWSLGCSM